MTGEQPAPRSRAVSQSAEVRFHPVPGFMGLPPARSPESGAARACVVGIPFDCGTHPFRVGSRQGPDAIREQSRLLRPVDIFRRHGIDNPSEFLRAVDVGNVACHPGDPDASFPLIEAGIGAILDAGAIPISMGGDGAVTLPQLRAVARRHPTSRCCISIRTPTPIPSRATTPPPPSPAPRRRACWMWRAVSMLARAAAPSCPACWSSAARSATRSCPSMTSTPTAPALDAIRQRIGQRPVYLCFDMDIFDPSCAPGVCTPEWGGLSPRKGWRCCASLRAELRGLRCQHRVAAAGCAERHGLSGRDRHAGILRAGGGRGAAVSARTSGLIRRAGGIHTFRGNP